MAEYDLGTAHGQIEIAYDPRGIQEAERSFQQLERIGNRLDKALSGTRRAVINAGRAFVDLNGGIKPAIENVRAVTGVLQNFHAVANRAHGGANRLVAAFRGFQGTRSIIMAIGTAFLGWGALPKNIGPLLQFILSVRAAIDGLKLGISIIQTLAAKFSILSKATAFLGSIGSSVAGFLRLSTVAAALGTALGFAGTRIKSFGIAMRAGIIALLPGSAALFGAVGARATALGASITTLISKIGLFGGALGNTGKLLQRTFNLTDRVSQSITRVAFFALNAKVAWDGFQKALRFAALGAAKLGAALSALTTIIAGIGTFILGTADALKQMSGVLVLLPGLITAAGLAAGTLAVGLMGVKDAFKALAGDEEAFNKTLEKLAPNAKSTLQALRGFKGLGTELKTDVQNKLFEGLADSIERLGGPMLGVVKRGMVEVAGGLNFAAKELVNFAGQQSTMGDLNTMFFDTNRIVTNLGASLSPLLTAFRDIAVVGVRALADLSSSAGGAATRFQLFIATARQTGDLRRWIDEGIQGFKDFGASIKNIAEGVKNIFVAFGSNSGDNALARLRELTDSFVRATDPASKLTTNIHSFTDALQGITAQYVDVLRYAFEKLGPAMEPIIDWFHELTGGVTEGLKKAITILAAGLKALNAVFQGPIGDVLQDLAANAIVAAIAFKALAKVGGIFVPIIAALTAMKIALMGGLGVINNVANATSQMNGRMVIAGRTMGTLGTVVGVVGARLSAVAAAQNAFMASMVRWQTASAAMAGLGGVAGVVSTQLHRMSGVAGAAAGAMSLTRSAASGLATMLGGPVGIAIITVIAALFSFKAASDAAKKSQEILDREVRESAEGVKSLVRAFTDDGGIQGKNVVTAMTEEVGKLKDRVKEAGTNTTGFMEDIGANLHDFFTGGELTGNSSWSARNNEMDTAAYKAQDAARAIEKLGKTDEEMGEILRSNDGTYENMIDQLKRSGQDGRAAAEQLAPLRQRFIDVKESMDRMTPGAVALKGAFDVLRDTTSSATDRLSAMKTALEALGLSKVDAIEAGFAVTQAVKELADTAEAALGPLETLGSALLNETGTGFNYANQSALALKDKLKPLGDALLGVAANAKSPQEVTAAFDQMRPVLDQLRTSANLSAEEFGVLAGSLNILPQQLEILVGIQGKDAAVADMQRLALQVQEIQANPGINITTIVNTEEARNALRGLGANVEVINSTTGEVRIVTNSPEVKENILGLISAGVVLNGQKPQVNINSNAGKVTEDANGVINKFDQINGKSPTVTVNTPGLAEADAQLQRVYENANKLQAGKQNLLPAGQARLEQQQMPAPLPPAPEDMPKLPPVDPPLVNGKPVVPLPDPIDIPPVPAPAIDQPVIPPPAPIELPPPPPPITVPITVEGTEAAKGEVDNFSASVDAAVEKWNTFKTAIANAMQEAATAINTFTVNVNNTLNSMAANAELSGAALGQGFANGIRSKTEEVTAAALALAEAASPPLPRSPAKIGPFSGKGWTTYRGQSLAEGFADGIRSGTNAAQVASLSLAGAVSGAIDMALAALGKPLTGFGENRTPGPGGKRYYRDPDVSNEELATKREEKRAEAAKDAALESNRDARKADNRVGKASTKALKSVEDMAEEFNLTITDQGIRTFDDGTGGRSYHYQGEAFDLSGSAEDMAAFNKYIAENDPNARELFYDPGVNLKDGAATGAIGGHSDHVHYVPGVEKAIDSQTKDNDKKSDKQTKELKGSFEGLDAEQASVAQAFIDEGRRRNLSDDDIVSALEAGWVESNLRNLNYGDGDSIGSLQQRDSWGTTEERLDPTKSVEKFYDRLAEAGPGTPGERAQMVQRSAFPDKYDQEQSRAEAILGGSVADSGNRTAESTEDILAETLKGNKSLEESVRIAQDPNSTDGEVIRALQTIDDTIATTEDVGVVDSLEGVRDAIKEDRGIKEYDPFEGATEDPLKSATDFVQNAFSLFEGIEGGINAAMQMVDLLARGISSTKDITTLVDGMQGIASTIGEVISTVGSMISTVASFAALAGAAIPGIGAVLGGISAVTGGISQVNGIIDLIQQGVGIGMRFFGGFLSGLAGGADGPLQGNIRTLLDTNDNTIKTWSDRNPGDKRIHNLPGGTGGSDPSNSKGIQNLNIYQGPGASPTQMMDAAMFAVAAHSTGVYGNG